MAVTMMSAPSSSPDVRRIPVLMKRSIWSVTTDAAPEDKVLKRSPFGTAQNR